VEASKTELKAFVRALRFDHLGEVSTEANFRLQAILTFDREVRAKAHDLADLEARTRDLIAAELALHGVRVGRHLWLKWLSFLLLFPVKLVIPTPIWVRLIYRSTLHALELYESQRARFGPLGSPGFWEKLVAHEVEQRDWAKGWIERRRAPV
jgi:hypothetical protein